MWLFACSFGPAFIKKLPIALLTIWFVGTAVFLLAEAAGGQEAMLLGEGRYDERTVQALRSQLGLDRPLHQQYIHQMSKVLMLDSVPSMHQRNQTFREILRVHLPESLALGWRALALAVMLGVPAGVLCAIRHNGWLDQGGKVAALVGVSVPNFVLASLAIYWLARRLQWFPATEWTNPYYMWIPAACLGAFPFAAILRLTRASMLEAMREDYIRTARAKGLSEFKVVVKHALRNSLSAVVTYIGPVTAGLLTGSLVVERIFNIPGIGDMFVKSVQNRDLPLIMGISVFFCMLLVTANLIVDSVYPVLNPRLREK